MRLRPGRLNDATRSPDIKSGRAMVRALVVIGSAVQAASGIVVDRAMAELPLALIATLMGLPGGSP